MPVQTLKKNIDIPSRLERKVDFQVKLEEVDEENRTLELSFSSDEPYKRWWGVEILDHKQGSVRLDRLQREAPLLFNHNWNSHIGRIEAAWLDGNKCRAKVRFSKGSLGQEKFQDVVDGILKGVSVGYEIHKMVLESSTDDEDTYRIVDWEPMEISLVTVPADMTVGVGRGDSGQNTKTLNVEVKETNMPQGNEGGPDERSPENEVNKVDQERQRVSEIVALASKHDCGELVEKSINDGVSVQEFQAKILSKLGKAEPIPLDERTVDIDDKDLKNYSVHKALRALSEKKPVGGFEGEVSQEFCRKNHKTTTGFFIPPEVLGKRLHSVTGDSGSYGGAAVMTEYGGFVETLREGTILGRLGATQLTGLSGNVAFVRPNGKVKTYWIGETSPADVTKVGLDLIKLEPHRHTGFGQFSDQLLMQTTPDLEGYFRREMVNSVLEALDAGAIYGSGESNEPKGILHSDNHYTLYAGSTKDSRASATTNLNGAGLTYADVVFMAQKLRQMSAARGRVGYLTNSNVESLLKLTQRFTGTDSPVWTDGKGDDLNFGTVNGRFAAVSELVPSDLTKTSVGAGDEGADVVAENLNAIILGAWQDLIQALWGGIEVKADEYTGMRDGIWNFYTRVYADSTPIRRESMIAIKDIAVL